jgi:protein SCO1/2
MALGCAASIGCRQEHHDIAEQARGPERRYELTGKVVSVEKERKQVTIAHEEIPGYMEAMTMPFALKDEWAFTVLAPGDNVTATLVVASGLSWLEGIVISRPGGAAPQPPAGAGLREPEEGDMVPVFALVNQDNKPLTPEVFRGKPLILTFIYTRCPLPDQCPRMTDNFAKVLERLEAEPGTAEGARLLSITVDPAFDTPEVLRAYAKGFLGSDADRARARWDFATGEPEEVRKVANAFGLAYSAETDQVVHTLRTAVIAPDGTVFRIYRGNDWTPEQAVRDLAAAARA